VHRHDACRLACKGWRFGLGVALNKAPIARLLPRERECLSWSAHGKTKGEIATILGISERTVKFHVDGARAKLDCSNTTHAVARGVALGLVDGPF